MTLIWDTSEWVMRLSTISEARWDPLVLVKLWKYSKMELVEGGKEIRTFTRRVEFAPNFDAKESSIGDEARLPTDNRQGRSKKCKTKKIVMILLLFRQD